MEGLQHLWNDGITCASLSVGIIKPRCRLINVRLSEEEFMVLQREMVRSGARSISEFCRTAILWASVGKQNQDAIHGKLKHLEGMLADLIARL